MHECGEKTIFTAFFLRYDLFLFDVIRYSALETKIISFFRVLCVLEKTKVNQL